MPSVTNFSYDLETYLKNWCDKRNDERESCYNTLWHHFAPGSVPPPKYSEIFNTLLRDILLSVTTLESEVSTAVVVYSLVAIFTLLGNIYLLCLNFPIPYKCSTAVFLQMIIFMDLFRAVFLLILLYYHNNGNLSYLYPQKLGMRYLNRFAHLFWIFVPIFIMLLAASDRCLVHKTRGRLFKQNRKTKCCVSMMVIVAIILIISWLMPSTIEINFKDEKVQIYVCITQWCYGSPLLSHSWRYSDSRFVFFLRTFQMGIAVVVLVLIPLYACLWSSIIKKLAMEKYYEKEREKIIAWGPEIIYFNNINKTRTRSGRLLPIIYEVDEDKYKEDAAMLFPYSLQILHEPSSLCPLSKKNNIACDAKHIPENATPLTEDYVITSGYDHSVDNGRIKKKSPKLPSKTRKKSEKRVVDLNRNALLSTSFRETPLALEISQTPKSSQTSTGDCGVFVNKENIKTDRGSFSSKQIALSINCCCSRSAPIECHTEITYVNEREFDNNPQSLSDVVTCPRNRGTDAFNVRTIEDTNKSLSTQQIKQPFFPQPRTVCPDITSFPLRPQRRNASPKMHVKLHKDDCDFIRNYTSDYMSLDTVTNFQQTTEKRSNDKCEITMKTVSLGDVNVLHGIPKTLDFIKRLTKTRKNTQLSQKNFFHTEHKHKFLDSNWNRNSTPNRDDQTENVKDVDRKRSKELIPDTRKSALTCISNNVPAVDFMSSKTLKILFLVREHFMEHSGDLKPLGVPESLETKVNVAKVIRRKDIIVRLFFLTLSYLFICLFPCLIELAYIPYNMLLYMTPHFSGTLQFISLLIFSKDFRHKLKSYCYC